MNRSEAISRWEQCKGAYAERGLVLPGVKMFTPDEWKSSNLSLEQLAMDAAAGPLSTDPNAALPAILTTAVDPDVIRIVFAPLQMAEILGGERKVGDWLAETRLFPVVEDTGEVSSYDDYSVNGRAGINFNYPALQSYLFQTIIEYGDRETARAGLMKINYVGDVTRAAAGLLNRFGNLSYAFGISGLQSYGLLNNPYLSAYITPAVKAWGGTTWFDNGSPAATANEVYNDIVALVERLISQTNGTVDINSKMTLAMAPPSQVAMTFANSFGVYVRALLKEGYPNLTVKTAVQYGAQTSTNSQGYSPVGNVMQLIVDELDGQKVAYPAYNEKMRAHKLVAAESSWRQKMTGGTWGCVLRIPICVSGMLGI
jgi:hypothetical protein